MSRVKSELQAEGFTVKANMKNVMVAGPLTTGIFKARPLKPTNFRKCYERGELPVFLVHDSKGSIKWKVDFDNIDYDHYLPLFFDGLCETAHPYETFARQGVHDLLDHGGPRILPVIPKLIIPIRNALNTRNHQVMCTTIKVLQHLMVSADRAGEALVPYFRQILTVFNIFKNKNKNLGDDIDCSHMRRENIADLIQETLQMFEHYGGPDAFKKIKTMIPTYQSCMVD